MSVSGAGMGTRAATPLYTKPLLFVPRGGPWSTPRNGQPVLLADIAAETCVRVPDACGLARATRDLFRAHRRKRIEYPGEAMSYQVLEGWAALGIGAAILPRSKRSAKDHAASPITDKAGQQVLMGVEAAWSHVRVSADHLIEFSRHLETIVPSIVAGLAIGSS